MSHSPQDVYKKILGKKGEKLAENYLKKAGFTLLQRNYTTPFGEADLLMQKGEERVFVEVKTRTADGYGTPAESVTKEKRKKYEKIAMYYLSGQREELAVRFDVVEVWADGRIVHIENAF
ncbi:MAG: YraN family protein [Clostridia bacterium]|nr:YraN family protein [Clostridia bacterium]